MTNLLAQIEQITSLGMFFDVLATGHQVHPVGRPGRQPNPFGG